MQKIEIYDVEAGRIEAIQNIVGNATGLYYTEAEIINALFDVLDENDIDLKEYLI